MLKLEPNAPITSARQITGFRNILIHNYARVSPAVVWTIVQDDLETLYNEVTALLES
jgi:uncharacterized protein with HEPN domain